MSHLLWKNPYFSQPNFIFFNHSLLFKIYHVFTVSSGTFVFLVKWKNMTCCYEHKLTLRLFTRDTRITCNQSNWWTLIWSCITPPCKRINEIGVKLILQKLTKYHKLLKDFIKNSLFIRLRLAFLRQMWKHLRTITNNINFRQLWTHFYEISVSGSWSD